MADFTRCKFGSYPNHSEIIHQIIWACSLALEKSNGEARFKLVQCSTLAGQLHIPTRCKTREARCSFMHQHSSDWYGRSWSRSSWQSLYNSANAQRERRIWIFSGCFNFFLIWSTHLCLFICYLWISASTYNYVTCHLNVIIEAGNQPWHTRKFAERHNGGVQGVFWVTCRG